MVGDSNKSAIPTHKGLLVILDISIEKVEKMVHVFQSALGIWNGRKKLWAKVVRDSFAGQVVAFEVGLEGGEA